MAANVFAMFRCGRSALNINIPRRGGSGIIAESGPIALLLVIFLGFVVGEATAAAQHPGPRSGKRLIWSDDFTGPAGTTPDPARWSFDTGGQGWGNKELQYYTPADAGNASVDGHGHLQISARKERYTGPDGVSAGYTSGRLQTLQTFEFTYGLLEARIRVPKGRGLLPTFWALGNDAYDSPGSWPASGEIDAMEVRGSAPSVLYGTIHGPWPWLPGGLGSELRTSSPLSRKFHVYGVEWSPSRITFLLDGRAYRTVRPADLRHGAPWPFRHPFFLLLNLTIGGKFAGQPAASTPFPATMSVDWVRVWQ
jgi:beta-glucanase (GH16 family)